MVNTCRETWPVTLCFGIREKVLILELHCSKFKSCLYYLRPLWLWINHLTSLSSVFFSIGCFHMVLWGLETIYTRCLLVHPRFLYQPFVSLTFTP